MDLSEVGQTAAMGAVTQFKLGIANEETLQLTGGVNVASDTPRTSTSGGASGPRMAMGRSPSASPT